MEPGALHTDLHTALLPSPVQICSNISTHIKHTTTDMYNTIQVEFVVTM